ncbi:hypothetical protein [Neptuniibacter sp. QD57_21]|uniref:hypothetical protein n=1 Tax=Neptuniibacter sp. QD57_21 TaxID=3398213 RepID=UPI0039F557D4
MAQYSLKLSDELYEKIGNIAKSHDQTTRELMIKLLKTGLIALEVHDDPKKELCIKTVDEAGNTVSEKQILFM